MTPKELKILIGILAAGQASWAWAWWQQSKLSKIRQDHIEVLEKHLALEERYRKLYFGIANDAIPLVPEDQQEKLLEAMKFQEIVNLPE